MIQKNRLLTRGIVFVLSTMMIAATIGLGFVSASPPTQDGFIPTPTVYPVDERNFTAETVGGEDQTLTFANESDDIFTLGDTTVTSTFPRGMVFTLPVESSAGEIISVRLNMTFITDQRFSVSAEYDSEANAWVARPWDTGASQPPWIPFEFEWSVVDAEENGIATGANATEYWDPTREWTRFESDSFVAYLYDYEDIYTTEELGAALTTAIESTAPRRVEGFGGEMSYKPIVVFYADLADYIATIGAGEGSAPVIGGYLRNEEGMTIQFFDADAEFGPEGRAISPDDIFWYDCVWTDPSFNPAFADVNDPANKFSLDLAIYEGAPRDITRLHINDYAVGNVPGWWLQGQADFFSYRNENIVLFDQRLQYLATLNNELRDIENGVSQDIPTDDGCVFLNYMVGHSFVNWFVYNYGIEGHADVVQTILDERVTLFDALEIVTEESFLDLQNAWRTYIGFATLSLEDVDPEAGLAEAVDPLYVEGETFTLTSAGFQIPLYSTPGANAAPGGACFNNTDVEVLRVGNIDGINYYEIDCQGIIGWLPEGEILP